MNLSFFHPGFLKKADQYLLTNYPMLWSTRVHCVLFYGGILWVITLLTAATYSFTPAHLHNLYQIGWTIFFASLFPVLLWLYGQMYTQPVANASTKAQRAEGFRGVVYAGVFAFFGWLSPVAMYLIAQWRVMSEVVLPVSFWLAAALLAWQQQGFKVLILAVVGMAGICTGTVFILELIENLGSSSCFGSTTGIRQSDLLLAVAIGILMIRPLILRSNGTYLMWKSVAVATVSLLIPFLALIIMGLCAQQVNNASIIHHIGAVCLLVILMSFFSSLYQRLKLLPKD